MDDKLLFSEEQLAIMEKNIDWKSPHGGVFKKIRDRALNNRPGRIYSDDRDEADFILGLYNQELFLFFRMLAESYSKGKLTLISLVTAGDPYLEIGITE